MKKHRGPRQPAGISDSAWMDKCIMGLGLFLSLLLWPALSRADLPTARLDATQDGCEVELKASFAYHDTPPNCIFTIYRIDEETRTEQVIFDGEKKQDGDMDCHCVPLDFFDLGDATDLVDSPCKFPGSFCDANDKLLCGCRRFCKGVSDRPGPGTFSYRVEGHSGGPPTDYTAMDETQPLTFGDECKYQGGCATESGRDDAPWVVFLGLLVIGLATWRRPSKPRQD